MLVPIPQSGPRQDKLKRSGITRGHGLAAPLADFPVGALARLGVSAALVIDYLRPLPAFCDVGSGCDQVRLSRFGTFWFIPVPAIGLASFALWMVVSLLEGERARFLTRAMALVAGATGILLLLTQAFAIKAF